MLIVRIEPRGSDQRGVPGTSERLDRIYRDLLHRIESIPGVRAASLAHYSPTSRVGYLGPVQVADGTFQRVSQMMVYPNYFAAMDMPLRAGRDFSDQDLDGSAPLVGVVNEAFVRQHMKGENPVGKRIVIERGDRVREIIGVVSDTKYSSLKEATPPLWDQPFLQTQTGRGQMTLHVRVADGAAAGVVSSSGGGSVRRQGHPLSPFRRPADLMNGLLSRERLVATRRSLFGVVALLLASVGSTGCGLLVVQRTGEMVLRMALAPAAERRPMVMRDAMFARVGLSWARLAFLIGCPRRVSVGAAPRPELIDPVTMIGRRAVLKASPIAATCRRARREASIRWWREERLERLPVIES